MKITKYSNFNENTTSIDYTISYYIIIYNSDLTTYQSDLTMYQDELRDYITETKFKKEVCKLTFNNGYYSFRSLKNQHFLTLYSDKQNYLQELEHKTSIIIDSDYYINLIAKSEEDLINDFPIFIENINNYFLKIANIKKEEIHQLKDEYQEIIDEIDLVKSTKIENI